MVISVFSLGCFILGVLAGRNLPGAFSQRSADDEEGRSDGHTIEIYVGNLPYETTEKELYKAFKAHGDVTSARIISNRFNGKSRGFGFVEMPHRPEAESAIRALNGKDMRGRKIVVNEAK
jgi:RNA recognition motif-containing protein